MNITTEKLNEVNFLISATIDSSDLDLKINRLAKEASTQMKIDGFRQGKVPVAIVKKMHGEKLVQDAESDAVQDILKNGTNELGFDQSEIIGQPTFKKFDKNDNGIDVEIEISIKPTFALDGYKNIAPSYEKPEVSDSELQEKMDSIISESAPFEKISDDRVVANGDMTKIDFEGSIDGVLFDGGTAKDFSLTIGSNQFIPGFEDQLIGMKMGEEKVITTPFPTDYQQKDLAGKDADFKVTLNEIQEKGKAELNDELASKLLQGVENATVEMLIEKVKEQITREKLSKLYNDELKPKLIESLVTLYTFDLPNNIVEQELDAKLNAKASTMSEDELKGYKDDASKVATLRETLREDANDSVKATFIVDAVAKEEKIVVSDDEVTQTIYYEAMMSGQNPQETIEYYQKNNLIPAVRMGMIEDKLFSKLLELDK